MKNHEESLQEKGRRNNFLARDTCTSFYTQDNEDMFHKRGMIYLIVSDMQPLHAGSL